MKEKECVNTTYNSDRKQTLSSFTVSSTNITSLCANDTERSKRKLELIKNLNTDISVIIDSRIDEKDLNKLYKTNKRLLSKYNVVSNYTKPRGITILIKKQTGITLGNVLDHEDKDILVISVLTPSNETVDIAAIYGPSDRDDPSFFQEVLDTLDKRGNKNKIIIGDWNTTSDRYNDERGYTTNCHKNVRELLRIWEENELMFDVLRFWQPDGEAMTWRTKKRDKSARLDMIWASENILPKVKVDREFNTFELTDHASIIATIDIEAQKSGPGIFRAKAGIQFEPKYQRLIKNTIKKIIFNSITPGTNIITDVQRALFLHRLEIETELDKLSCDEDENDMLKLHKELQYALLLSTEPSNDELLAREGVGEADQIHEKVLAGIKAVTVSFCKTLKQETTFNTGELKKELGMLIDSNHNNINDERIAQVEAEIETIEQEWLKTILVNDERFAMLDDEKPTKAFLNMESERGGYSNIVLLKEDELEEINGRPVKIIHTYTEPKVIRDRVKNDFQSIFNKQPNLKTGMDDLKTFLESDENETGYQTPLDELNKRKKEASARMIDTDDPIKSSELEDCLFTKMKGNSAPGIDGFTVSWLRVFWADMKTLTAKAINKCYEKGKLTDTMNTAVVKLLRKGSKDPTYSNSYRPISLLSIHYKLASCVITQRLKPIMQVLIGRQQKAYINNNVIGSCLINLISAIKHVSEKQLTALVLLIDFRKAFDSIDHRFIRTALTAYGFGERLIKWIELFFDKREAFILLGGHKTDTIKLEQGVPQGDVVSPYIFILMVEILLIKINYTKNIKGIIFAKEEARSETFADDTTILIERDERQLRFAIKYIEEFHTLSGLKCNLDKTVVIPIGANTDKHDSMCPDLNLKWDDKFTLLGFELDNKLESLDNNFQKCLHRAKRLVVKWRKYFLSILGRITVAKSMILSQFTYVVSVLEMNKQQINQIQQ